MPKFYTRRKGSPPRLTPRARQAARQTINELLDVLSANLEEIGDVEIFGDTIEIEISAGITATISVELDHYDELES